VKACRAQQFSIWNCGSNIFHSSFFLLHSRSRKFPGNNEKGRRKKEKYAPPSPAARPNFFKLRIAVSRPTARSIFCAVTVYSSTD
jgi:hypothetical protein